MAQADVFDGVSRAREDRAGQDASLITTTIVVPAYNEVDNVRPLVEEIESVLDSKAMAEYAPVEVLFVDDCSTDGTRQVLREVAAENDRVSAIFLRRNFGQTPALAAGIDVAVGDYVVTMDADRQNNPADLPALLDTLAEGYDCVSGWRRERNDPLSKKVPSAIQTYLARLTGPDIHDFGCTLTAYRIEALEDINLYGEGHRYIPAKLHKRGYRITEIEVDHRPRTEGDSKYGLKRLLKGFVDLLFHIFWNRFSTRPLHFLGGGGMILLSIGLVIGSHAVILKYALGVELLPRTPRLILTIALVLFGFQLIMFGFLAEMMIKVYYRDDREYRIESIHTGIER